MLLQTNRSAATGLLAGILGGNVTGGIAAGSAPYMAALVKDATSGEGNEGAREAARVALHAIVSGALASAQGANPGAAAAGGLVAAAGSDTLALAFYGKKASELVGDEKMLISNLVTILGSAAGGAVGGDGLSIASGGNAARVEVENNALGDTELVDLNVCLLTGSETACARANKTPEQYATGVAVTLVTIGGIAIVGATPEIIAAARVAIEGCKANPIYCLNSAGIQVGEAVIPGGTGAAGSFVIGNTVSEVNALKNVVGNKVIIGPWSNGVSNIVKGEVFTQCANGSCVSATGQVLTNGAVTEAQLLKMLGEWSHPEALAKALGKTTGSQWVGGYFETAEQALQIAQRGKFGAVLQAPGAPAHMVTIEPLPASSGTFKVYDTGAGATYEVSSDWIKKYVSGGVWE